MGEKLEICYTFPVVLGLDFPLTPKLQKFRETMEGSRMSGLYFLFSLIGFGVIAIWYIQNDKKPIGGATRGLLRMKERRPFSGSENSGTDRVV